MPFAVAGTDLFSLGYFNDEERHSDPNRTYEIALKGAFQFPPRCYLENSGVFHRPRGTKIIRVLGGEVFGPVSRMSDLLTFLYLFEFNEDLVAEEGFGYYHPPPGNLGLV